MNEWKRFPHDAFRLDDEATAKAYRAWKKRALAAEARVQRVQELHQPYRSASGLIVCTGCGHRWGTCPTLSVMDDDG